MTSRLRPFTLAVLVAALLMTVVVPAVDARMPRATRYHVGGRITLDTNLLSASGVSAWAIDEYLKATTPLPPLGAAFLSAEKKYGVNARFLLAAALHESGWGTSYISRAKHNLFGYNAYDRDPVRYASAYATYAANIDATAKFIKDFYLTRGGRWWGGQPTLRSMQQFWSSSHTWGVGVSRIATSIHLGSIARRSIAFAAPVPSGPLHGGSQARVSLTWTGGAVPKGIGFVAIWKPIELDADVVAAAAVQGSATGATGAVNTDAAAAPSRGSGGPTSVAARRVRTANRSITLAVVAPREPGTYLLDVEMRDSGNRPLPAAEQLDIPGVEVQVWGDRAVSYDLEPSLDGTGAVVRITNTGRTAIPAIPSQVSPGPRDPEAPAARSVVTVTASSSNAVNPQPVVLLAAPLTANLPPGASVTFAVPGIEAATGRKTNWLSVNLSVLGDASWLAASSTGGGWFSNAVLTTPGSTGTAVRAGTEVHESPPTVTQAPTQSPTPTHRAAPTATPRPTPMPRANPTPIATVTPKPVPAPSPTPAPARVTKSYSEHSGSISYHGTWGNAPNRGYIGGGVAWSKTPGSTATFTFTGSSVSWLGPKGPTRGKALVLLDGRVVARVDMWRSSFVARAVLFKHSFGTTGRHTLTIKVLSTPHHPCVAIDGFSVRS